MGVNPYGRRSGCRIPNYQRLFYSRDGRASTADFLNPYFFEELVLQWEIVVKARGKKEEERWERAVHGTK